MTGIDKFAHYFFQKRVSSQRAILRASIPTLSDCRHIPNDNGRTATNVSWVLERNRKLHPGLLRSAYHHNVGNSEGYLFVSMSITRKSKVLLDHLSRGEMSLPPRTLEIRKPICSFSIVLLGASYDITWLKPTSHHPYRWKSVVWQMHKHACQRDERFRCVYGALMWLSS